MNIYTDTRLRNSDLILSKVKRENTFQLHKWGVQTHTAFEWLTYTTEELGELAQAISEHEYREGSKECVVNEAIQVATLALKIAEMFEVGEDKEIGG